MTDSSFDQVDECLKECEKESKSGEEECNATTFQGDVYDEK